MRASSPASRVSFIRRKNNNNYYHSTKTNRFWGPSPGGNTRIHVEAESTCKDYNFFSVSRKHVAVLFKRGLLKNIQVSECRNKRLHIQQTNLRLQGFQHNVWNWVSAKFIWDKIVKNPFDQWCSKCRAYLQDKNQVPFVRTANTDYVE